MDLKTYVESELDEERELGYTAAVAQNEANGYPGDQSVLVPEDDVAVSDTELSTPVGLIKAYIAAPRIDSTVPAIVVIHENKGLVPYIKNVARRLATEGYIAVAPDLLSSHGGTDSFENPADATKALAERSREDLVADVRAVIADIATRDDVNADQIGIIGFCFGGGVSWQVLAQEPRLKAGVPFYGPTPSADAVPGITAPVMGIYGELDQRITGMLPDIEAAMESNGKTFKSVVFPGAQHAFHNDTNPDRYNAEAAASAWREAVGWLDDHLK